METFPRVIFRNKTGGKKMRCERCKKNKAVCFYHAMNVCHECFKEMLGEDKGKRRLLLILKKRGEKWNKKCII